MTDVPELVDDLFRRQYGKMVAVLTSLFGFDHLGVAEELVQETLFAALHHWALHGVPDRPEAWLMHVAKNKALNHVKRQQVRRRVHGALADEQPTQHDVAVFLRTDIEDSVLRMMFACCHPDLRAEDQVALILKVLGGFGSTELARALLISEDALNKRVYRAKREIVGRGIRLEVPGGSDLVPRLGGVCQSLYLLFNEGYSATEGDEPIRRDLCAEAMRLCRLLIRRFPDHGPAHALLALMCFHVARFDSRIDDDGALVVLARQDRSAWDQELIGVGMYHLTESAGGDVLSRFHLEASIAAQHCLAPSFDQTDWAFIGRLYRRLYDLAPNPVVRLNLAIVASQVEGLPTAVGQLEALRGERKLARYPLLHATLGEFYRRQGRNDEARAALQTALSLTTSAAQHAFLEARLAELASTGA